MIDKDKSESVMIEVGSVERRKPSPPDSGFLMADESMGKEFVVIDDHKEEVEWIDPVLEIEETDDAYKIYNGYYYYHVSKKEGFQYIIRDLER